MPRAKRDVSDQELHRGFAVRLRRARERRGLSQIELSRMLGVGETRYNNWERGLSLPSSIMPFKKLCETLGVTADYLLFDERSGLSGETYRELIGGDLRP